MITAPDAEHARLRRLTGPGFTQNGLYEVEPVMQQYTDLLISQLTDASTEGSQNMVEWYLWTLNDVIGQLALGQHFECLAKRRMHVWPEFMMSSLKSAAALNQFARFGLLRFMGPLIPQKLLDARQNFTDIATKGVQDRLARGPRGYGKPDFIGLMLREMKGREGLSELELIANSTLLVAGGSETTSSCLTAMTYFLCKTPRVMRKLREELRARFKSSDEITLKATGDVPYLVATVDEALRIFPIASYITPRVTLPDGNMIAGEHVPGNVGDDRAEVHFEQC
jgi:aspirochlorine biosynthesis cytochrome P450 monooxygenase